MSNDNNLLYDAEGNRVPYSVEAEQAVLGAMIIDPQCIADVITEVKPEYFYIPQNKEIMSLNRAALPKTK